MKRWQNPQLFTLGLKGTKDYDCSLLASWGQHTCHREPGEHNGNCSTGQGHKPSVGCTDESHYKDGIVNCCCHGVAQS